MFEVISINAGYLLQWEPIGRIEWQEANIGAYNGRLEPLVGLLKRSLKPM